MRVTADQLIRGMNAIPAAAYLWVDAINEAIHVFRINENKTRLASFLAQVAHESGSLKYAREVWGPIPQSHQHSQAAHRGLSRL